MTVYSLTRKKDNKCLGKFTHLEFSYTNEIGESQLTLFCNSNTVFYDGLLYRIFGSYPNSYIESLPVLYVGVCELDSVLKENEITDYFLLLTMVDREHLSKYLLLLHEFISNQIAQLKDEELLHYDCLIDTWYIGRKYKRNDVVKFGVNDKQEPKIYRVVKDHTSKEAPRDNLSEMYIPIN